MFTLDVKKKKLPKKEKLRPGDRSKSDSHMQPPPPYVADDAELMMSQQGDGWLMPQREYTFETYRPVGNSMHKQEKVKVQNQLGGLNLQQQQYLLQQHWKDKELIENQQKKIIEQKRIISEQQRQIIQQNETHLFFQEQINTLQQQVNSLSNQNQRLSADFSVVRSPLNAASPQSNSSPHSSGGYTHSPTPLTSTRGYPLEYPRGVPPPYSTCPPPYYSTSRPIVTESKTQSIARNAGMVDGKMLGVANPPMMITADRKMLPQQQQGLPLSAAGMQQPIPIASSSSVHLYPPTGGPPLTSAIKVLSPTPSPPTDGGQNFFTAKLAPPTSSGIHHPLPPTTTVPAYSTSSRMPLEKTEVPSEQFDPLEFQKFADNEVNRLSEAGVAAAAAAGGSDSEIWQLSLPSLDVATGYGVSVNTDEGKGLDIINTNVKCTRCVCVCRIDACMCTYCVPYTTAKHSRVKNLWFANLLPQIMALSIDNTSL